MNISNHKSEQPSKAKPATGQHQYKNYRKNFPDEYNIANSVLANLNLHVAVVDEEGILVSVNTTEDEFEKRDGPLLLSDSWIGNNYFDVCRNAIILNDITLESVLDKILDAFNTSQPKFELEYTCHSLQGDKTYLLCVFRLSEDASKLVISHQNITKKTFGDKSTTELENKLAELTTIVDSSLDVICTINREGKFVTLNYAVEDIFGYLRSDLIGVGFIDFVHKDDVELTISTFNQIINGEQITLFENRCLAKNGNAFPILWSIRYNEGHNLMYCVGKDVTERKKLEMALEKERNQFYDIFQKAPAAVGLLKGPNHIFEMANPFYLKLIKRQNIIGKTVFEVLPEVIEQGFVKILDSVFVTGKPFIGEEILVHLDTAKDGKLTDHYVNYVYTAYRNSSGEIDGIMFFINDVTEQVESRKRIEASEKQYRLILETAQEGIWVLDKNSSTTFVNKKICEILGFTEKQIFGRKHTHFMSNESKKRAVLALESRKKGKSENFQLTFVSKKGEDILTNVSATPIFDHAGKFMGSLGMLSNITEKKHLENLLEKSNRLARIGSWEIDVVNGTVFWSDITKEIREAEPDFIPDLKTGIGYFKEGANKKTISQRVLQCIKDGTPWDEELQLTTFKGNLKWVRTIGNAVFINGKCSKIYGSFQDITERKNAIEEVMRSEARLNIAQLMAHVGSWEINIRNNEQTWSAEFYRILEIDESVKPSVDAFLRFVHRDDRAHAIKIMADAFPNQIDSSFDFRFTRKDGELGYALSEWKFEFDSNGNPLNIYGILRDLTNEKKAENERAKMISDITQRNKDLEQFSYIISHNLRAPVANIIGLAEELKDETRNDELKLMLTEALSSDVKRLENVIVDLNSILQTKREINERKETVNFYDLVHNIKLSINDLIEERGVVITTDFSQMEEAIIIKSYIHSIFYNLISNSIKYRQNNCDAQISISADTSRGYLVLVFKDNGRGIDLKAKGDQVFGLYKRFHTDTEGKGMGLYMVKTQIESLGGRISIQSEVDLGTTFTIEFENIVCFRE